MQKLFKRSLSALLAVLMMCAVFTLAPVTASADIIVSGIVNNGSITWTLTDDGVLTFSGTGDIPGDSFYDDLDWRKGRDASIEEVVIGNGITGIGTSAFCYCYNLKKATIADSVTSIGDYAFSTCYKLRDLELPEGLQTIGQGAFTYCGSTYNDIEMGTPGYLIIPSTVTSVGSQAFYNTRFGTVVNKASPSLFDDNTFYHAGYDYYACVDPANDQYDKDAAAQIQSSFTVSYDANGDDSASTLGPAAYTSNKVTIGGAAATNARDRRFVGWSLTKDSVGLILNPGDTVAFASDVTLYAIWEDQLTFYNGDTAIYTTRYIHNYLPYSRYDDYDREYDVSTLSFTDSAFKNVNADDQVLGGYNTMPDGTGPDLFGYTTGYNYETYNYEGQALLNSEQYYTAPTGNLDPNSYEYTLAERKQKTASYREAAKALTAAADNTGNIKLYAKWIGKPSIINGLSISLGGDITVYVHIQLPDGLTPADYSSIYLATTDESYIDLHDPANYTENNGNYCVPIRLCTKQMADEFTATLFCVEAECGYQENISVKNYAETIIKGNYDEYLQTEYGYSEQKLIALKELLKSMLTLGAKAQTYFGSSTGIMADEDIRYTPGTYDITVDYEPDNSTDTGLYQVTPDFSRDTAVYFVNKYDWEHVYIDVEYYYTDQTGDKSGEYFDLEMTPSGRKKDGHDIYTYIFPNDDREYHVSCFKNGTGDDPAISFYTSESGMGYLHTPEKEEYNGETYWEDSYEEMISNDRLQFVNTQGWSTVYIWDVDGGTDFPGLPMSLYSTNSDTGESIYTIPMSDVLGDDPYKTGKFVFSDGNEENATVPVMYSVLGGYKNYVTPKWRLQPRDKFASLNVTYEGSSIGMHNTTSYAVVFRVDENTQGFKVLCNGEEVDGFVVEDYRLYADEYRNHDFWIYRIYGISPEDIDEDITLTLHADSIRDPITGLVTQSVETEVKLNPVTYIKNADQLEGERHEDLKALTNALYDFNRRAITFVSFDA